MEEKIWVMAKTGKWQGEPKVLKKLVQQVDDEQRSPLHIAAQHGKLNNVPDYLLTHENVKKQDNSGKTVLHHAVIDNRNSWSKIPKSLLTPDNALIEDINKNTIFHLLAYSKNLDKIEDKKLLKEKYLMAKNGLGLSPIEYICHGKQTSTKLFKELIKTFSLSSLQELKNQKTIQGEFAKVLEKEEKNRAIQGELSKHNKQLEIG
jgi:ankyrin repeat protein